VIDGPETMHYRVEQDAEDKRARDFEFAPKLRQLALPQPVTVAQPDLGISS